jgi:hypothetical protein
MGNDIAMLVVYGGPPAVVIGMFCYGIMLLRSKTDPTNPSLKIEPTTTQKISGIFLMLASVGIVWLVAKSYFSGQSLGVKS